MNGKREEWAAERLEMERQSKIEHATLRAELESDFDSVQKGLHQKITDSEAAAKFVEKRLTTENEKLRQEAAEKVRRVFNLALQQFLSSARKKKNVSAKVTFAAWRNLADAGRSIRREAEEARKAREGTRLEKEKWMDEREALKKEHESEVIRRENMERLKDEERKKAILAKVQEAVKTERARAQVGIVRGGEGLSSWGVWLDQWVGGIGDCGVSGPRMRKIKKSV